MTGLLWLARLLPAMGLILLCVTLLLGNARAQTTPAAPTIDSVASGDVSLTVTWTAPTGESGITAYDVRNIKTSEDESVDANWTVVDSAWTSGALEYTITGLDNGTQYDVQVRAVNSNGDGAWSVTTVGTPALPAPIISSVRADDRALLVSWSALTGITSKVQAYDVRYIETGSDETVDSNWSVEDDAWEVGDGSLSYAITVLTNGTGYDVQVRAVDEDGVDGAWSATTAATPQDHSDTRSISAATAVNVSGDRVWGAIDSTDDEDYFLLNLPTTGTNYWIYTQGNVDTVGVLMNANGETIESDDYGGVLPNPDNFFLWSKLQHLTYYIKVTGYGDADEPYVLRVRAFPERTGWPTADPLPLNGSASGTIDPKNDYDFFKIVLSETTEVAIRSSGFPDTVGELYRSGSQSVASNDDGYLPGGSRNFLIRRSLPAGTYYLNVSSWQDRSEGPFSVYLHAITEPGSTKDDAEALTLGGVSGGIIDPGGDEDYFSLTLDERTHVIVGGTSRGQGVDISAELKDSNDFDAPIDSYHFSDRFVFQGTLDAGTYHLKVTGKDDTDTGRYTVRAIREGTYTYFENRCSNISRSSGINDPLYGCQWHLKNNDQFRNSAGQDIGVEEVWPTYTGSGINVAVVDDGMHYTHEDLKDNVDSSLNHNYNTDDTDIYDYFEWHGTAVAGLIAAKDNGLGVRGVAPEATIYGYNYLVSTGDASRADAMTRNASVTAVSNNSWGPRDYGEPNHVASTWEMAVTDGVTNGYGGKGVFYVWSAGNGAQSDDDSNLDEIANYYAVTAVCAVGHDDKRSEYSEPGTNLWVCGPSSSGRTGQPSITTTDNGNRYWGRMGGTSASAPIVSGVVALVREANNALTWRDVKLILAASARQNDPDNTGWEQGAVKYGSTTDRYNFNHEYGFGMVDAKAATDLAVGWTNAPAFRQITTESGTINLSLPDAAAVVGEPDAPRQVSTTLTVGSFVDFIEFVEVNTHFSHTSFRDLKVELVSPSGAVSLLVPYADLGERVSLRSAFRFGSARHLGENAAGTWTLRITDYKRQSGRAESLRSWGLTIYGHGFKPGAPEIDDITPGPGTLAVEWKVPTDTGKTAITSYDLRYIRKDASDKSDGNWTEETSVGSLTNRSYTITGLSGNVEYEIQLRARNSEGIGVWSESTDAVPTIGKPSAPFITSVTRGDRTLGVAWDAPSDNGGGTITAYDVRYIETSADETVDSNWTVRDNAWRSGDLRYVIRNLTNATGYDVQVRAVNSAGDGDWSATETGTPLPDDIPIQMQWDDSTIDIDEDGGSVVLTAVFTTTLNAPPESDFEFDIAITTTDLRATKDQDYTPPPTSSSFVASDFSLTTVNGNQRYQATRDFTVAIIDDTVDESVEDFRVTMNYETSGLQHLQGGPRSATITINDNEHVPVTLTWERSDITVDEDDGSATLRAFAVTTVDKQPEDGFTFDASIYTSNGSAVQISDYTEVDDTVTFDRNDFSRVTVNGQRRYRAAKQITVPIVDDTADEIEEEFTVTVEYANPSPPHLQGGSATATVKIADDEYVPVTIGWREAAVTANEDGGSVTLYAQSTTTEAGTPLSDLTFDVRITTSSGSARQNSDFTHLDATGTFAHTDFSSTLLDGELRYRAEKQITISILDDILRESNETFTVRVAYSNPSLPFLQGSSATATITIFDDENQKPVISTRRPPSTYRENGTSAIYTFRASDPQEGPITWSLEGTDQGVFVITVDSSGRGVLTFSSPPDFENPLDDDGNNDYELTVVAADQDSHSDRISFTIAVTDVNEGPEISRVGSAPGRVPENQPQDTVLARYTATDPENPAAQITRWSTSGTDGGDFVINEQGELRFRNTPDYERAADSNLDNYYVFSVRAYDGRVYGYFDETVTVTPVNEPPTITTTSTSATSLRQPENRTSRLYTYRATDPEGASTVSWSVGGADARFFAIDEYGQFSFSETSPPDYELPGDSGGDNVYNVVVQATDDDNNTARLDVTITVTDVNEGPEVTGGGDSFTVRENSNWSGASFSAFDPERGTVTRWALGGRDGGDFTIAETGVMTFRSVPDYERPADSDRDNVYEVEVRPYDGRYYGSHPATVTVEDVDEITGPSTINRSENFDGSLGSYSAVGRGDLAVEPKWSLSGTDGGDFTIDESGQLTFRSVPDYERPADSNRDNTYQFTVRTTDDRYYGTLDVTVVVAPVNEPPTITTSSTSATSLRQPENRTSRLYTYRATDPEGAGTVSWSVGGVDGRFFAIDERGQFSFSENSPPDYEVPGDSGGDNVYNVVVQATDDDNNTAPLDVTITVTDVNEGPEVSGPASLSIQENRYLTNAVYTAIDPEGANVARWNVGGRDGGDFFITQGGTLFFRNLPDYERPADSNRDNTYEIFIQPSDSRYTGSYPVTVTVTNVDEPPKIRSGSRTSFSQPENRASRLYSFSATDPEGSTVTWSVGGTDGSQFAIDERGQFSFDVNNPPDFDRPGDQDGDNIYNVTIQAQDPQSNTASLPVTVVVTEVNEGPVITRQGDAPGSVPENHSVDEVLAKYTASDPERPSVQITQWSTSGRDGGDFVINALGELKFRNSPDYERPADSNRDNVYEVTIRASDGRYTGTLEEIQTVTVTDVNEPPTITTTSRTSFTLQENRTSTLYTFRATDPEGGTIAWSPAGTDGSAFAMDERGALSFANPPDFDSPGDSGGDNVYDVTVQARDPEGNPDILDVTVTVTDHNEGVEPTISTRRPPTTYRENNTRTIYTFHASDPQRGAITWTVTGTDSHAFAITVDSSGRGVLAFNSPPDFESPTDSNRDNVYELAVVATDEDSHSDRVDFTITVTDHDEGVEPTINTRRPPSTYRENDMRTVYTFRATDPQRGTITWTVTGVDASDFAIASDSSGRGVLTFDVEPDFENPVDSNRDNIYELAVVATDEESHTDRVTFTITVTDVNEGPVISLESTATTSVPENYAETGVLADYEATDPENPGAGIFRWSTLGRDGGDFVINELGELRFRSSPDFERPVDSNRDNVYELMVRAYDGRVYGTLEDPLLITVTQVNEAPVITTKSRTSFSLRENSTSNIYTYRATDQDVDDAIRWSVEGPDAGDFAIYDGVLNFRLLPDFEIPADADEDNVYEITVVAADSEGLRDTVDAVISITDQSEGPVIAGPTLHAVAENYDIAQVLGSYTATDAKDGRAVYPQWSLSGRDGGDFLIDRYSGALTFRNTPDYDRPADSNRDNVYEFTIRGHDSRAYGYLDVSVTVTPINEGAPVVTGRTALSVRENTSTVIYTYRATDPDLNDSITWSTDGPDGRLFQVSERGELSFMTGPDFEDPSDTSQDNVYDLEVVATDGQGLRGTLGVMVTVTALDEGPKVSGTANFTVNENQDLPGATYTARDPEAVGGLTTTITWSTSGRDGGDFTIDRKTGVLTFRTLPDHERPADSDRDNVYQFTVRAHDGRNYGYFDATVAVEDVAEVSGPPVLSRAENFQGTLATYSPAGQGVLDVEPEWRLTGTDSGDFLIDRETGELTFRNLPDHERPADSNRDNVYNFVVQVSDGSYYETLDVTATVTAENEPPAITGRDSMSFRENTPTTTRLYTYRATDPEGDAFTWGLGGSDASDFTITTDSSGRGVLTFYAPPDYDSPAGSGSDANQYLVTIQARDDQGNTGELPVTVTVTDQNEGPTITDTGANTAFTVRENHEAVLFTYSATDPEEPGAEITRWSTSGRDGGDFTISESGELTFRNTPDYDRPADSNLDNEYLVTVRAYDGRTYGTLDVTITVSNVNEHTPVIRSGSRTTFTYREESTSVLYTYSATDGDKDDLIVWTAGGTDGRFFEFNDRNGLVFTEPPDYEDPRDSGGNNEYELTVLATDSGGLTASLGGTVTVTAVEEGPEITGTTTHTVTENQDLIGATFTARDPEDPDAEVSRWSLAGSDAGDFTITDTSQQAGQNSAQLTFRNPPDYDRPADSNLDNEYLVTIRAYNGSTYGSLDVLVTVTDVNEAEPVVSGRETMSFRENTPITTRLYRYSASDADRGAEITWSLRGTDSDDFTITEDSSGRGELFFNTPPNHEQPADSNSDNVYEITIVASDGSNEGTLDVSVTVTDVNEGPEISGQGSRTVLENFSQVLATYSATDPEVPSAEITRWSTSGRDGGDFTVNEDGELSFRYPPDFERPADSDRNNEYQFTIRASDGRVYGTFDVTVTVDDLNEAPEFRSSSRTSFSFRENGTSTLYTYRATDPEGSDVVWSLRGADAGDFVISETGVLSFASPPDFDNPAGSGTDGNEYLLTVFATDDGSYGADSQLTGTPLDGTLDVTVTVTDQNEGPTITETGSNTAFTVRENHEAVLFTYNATDPENPDAEITRWSTSGRDGGDFTINESGELTFRNPPDFERPADSNRDNIYELTVRASDGRYYGTLDVTVTVQAVDESPEFRSGSQHSFVYRENGTSAIYTYRATDPEGTEVSWGWSGTDSSAFTVSESGVLSFVSPPDYESPTDSGSDNVYELVVEASDEQSNTRRLEVTVTVTNLTDASASIRGTARVGRTLTADTSGVSGKGNQDGPVFSYQWMADDKDIEGATGSTYEVADDDEGKALKVKVTFTDDEGNEGTVTSAPTEEVAGSSNNAATGAPTITGTAQVGQTLTAGTSGISDADGLDNATFGYQWLADGANIEDSTGSTHVVSGEDVGKAIRVRVTFSDDRGNTETLTSAATELVTPRPPFTASFLSTPSTHDGAEFTFELRFSEEPPLSYVTLRDHAFTIEGGTVERARRLDRPSNLRWEITVQPASTADVEVVLLATTDCDAQGAICTEDGRMLSGRLELTVSGPGT